MVIEPVLFESNAVGASTMIKHCYANGFWIVIPVQGNKWQTYYLSGSSVQIGQQSPMPVAQADKIIEVSSTFKGDKIAASTYGLEGFVTLYDFDSKCGLLSNEIRLPQSTTQIAWDYPLGLDFSPNDQFLYVCYSGGLSQLVQYKVSDVFSFEVIKSTQDEHLQFDDILMGPDGRAYLNRHNFGSPSRQMDVIEFPNAAGVACGLKENEYQLKEATNGGFQLPPYINAYTANYCEHDVSEFRSGYTGTPCVDDTIDFYVLYPQNTFTSVKWIIDYAGNISTETVNEFAVNLTEKGLLKVTLVKFFCNLSDTSVYELEVESNPTYTLTKDSTICYGETVDLKVITDAQQIVWSTGETSKDITVKPNLYTVSLSNGQCMVRDSVLITSHPSLSILLKDNYYICEKENELVALDAGKGFVNYLWHPTQDTAQWIIVNKVGNYYVVVDDFRGCKGDKGAKVQTRCDLIYYVPNAFSPNGDGRNDNFTLVGDGIKQLEMQIYNRWGELIFKGNDKAGWSGAGVPEGVYPYLITVRGYSSKRKVIYNLSGNVTLLK